MSRSRVSNAPQLPVCIYCRATGAPFSRDHVIPEAFGKFENNFVLTCVCSECNQFFGDELELVLGRNSREAILRLHHGVKAPAGAAQLKYENAELRLGVHLGRNRPRLLLRCPGQTFVYAMVGPDGKISRNPKRE